MHAPADPSPHVLFFHPTAMIEVQKLLHTLLYENLSIMV